MVTIIAESPPIINPEFISLLIKVFNWERERDKVVSSLINFVVNNSWFLLFYGILSKKGTNGKGSSVGLKGLVSLCG